MFTYVAYGLGIRSVLELPELMPGPAPSDVPSDVVIRLGSIPEAASGPTPGVTVLWATEEEACLRWPEAGTILVRQGCEVTVDPAPGAEPRLVRLYLLGPALALLLHQRGLLVLHASAVALDGGVVAFLGHSGHGKSTTAATLHARGCRVVADDVVALDLSGDGVPVALPGAPELRLWPDAALALGEAPDTLPRVHPREEKRACVVAGVGGTSAALRRVYVLADDESLEIEPLNGHAAAFALLQHSYVAGALEQLRSARHLAQCARVAGTVPIRRLRRPRSLIGLGELGALIEADARVPHGGARPTPLATTVASLG